jgi:2-oxoglutarate ferredoxin oxidoreductase subunit alpha
VEIPDSVEVVERPQPTGDPKDYRPFDYSSSDVPPLAVFGSGYRFHVTGLLHDERGAPTEDSSIVDRWWTYMDSKLSAHLDEILDWDEVDCDDADTVIVAYGCTARSAAHAVAEARAQGEKVGLVKLKTIWPFADPVIDRLAGRVRRFIVPELNLGQIRLEVERACNGRAIVDGIHRADGLQISPDQILSELRRQPASA